MKLNCIVQKLLSEHRTRSVALLEVCGFLKSDQQNENLQPLRLRNIKVFPVDKRLDFFFKHFRSGCKWNISRTVSIMPTQIICTLQVYLIASGCIRPCSEHNISLRVVGSDSSVCV